MTLEQTDGSLNKWNDPVTLILIPELALMIVYLLAWVVYWERREEVTLKVRGFYIWSLIALVADLVWVIPETQGSPYIWSFCQFFPEVCTMMAALFLLYHW